MIDDPIGRESRNTMLGRSLVFGLEKSNVSVGDVVSERVEPGDPRTVIAGEIELDVEAGKYTLVVVEPWIVGTGCDTRIDGLIGVAEENSLTSSPLRQSGHVVEAIIEGSAVRDHSMVHLVHTGVETGSTRSTWRGLCVVAGETCSDGGEGIEVWSANDGMSGARERITPELIKSDEEDVRTGRCHGQIVSHHTTRTYS
jgi:hypothetical protein